MQLVDTHCHIHEADPTIKMDTETRRKYEKAGWPKPDDMIAEAIEAGVSKMICVGTTLADSQLAVQFVQTRPNCWASIGIHPHEAKDHLNLNEKKEFEFLLTTDEGWQAMGQLPPRAHEGARGRGKWPDRTPTPSKVVAIGECGLDYYYADSPKAEQAELLHFQLQLAEKYNLPVIFHVRDAFDDFWPIFDQYKVRGVIHSFSATRKELDKILARDLFVGLNGIMTFTKNEDQLEAAKVVPLENILLETDAPFLTPDPHRGTICKPKHVSVIAAFLANLRGESVQELARHSTSNAHKLFGIADSNSI
ncbi:MAG TPA: TatD family hydrolase [Candidatus Saccharimonadales bacterium]|nr:TatD family hydrolase [Candidatus Saccharimonadales bacterium]